MKTSALLLLAATLVGCTTYDTPNHGCNVTLERAHNFLGIVTIEPGSYASNNSATIPLRTDELYSRRTSSGDRITLFWGAITLTDY
ncbi:MAG: hypothetical protein ACO23N_05120 [Opitutales bacterium]